MGRITRKNLEFFVKQINEMTGSPTSTYTKTDKGYKANIGNYHLDCADGGVKLVRLCNEGGGITDISRNGYGTKRELYNWMEAFLAGMKVTK